MNRKIKKKSKISTYIIGIISGLSLFIFGAFFLYFFQQPCSEPTRPLNVPVSAIWNGGCDGGYWFELIEVKDTVCQFKIYTDHTGVLLLDADFEIDKKINLNMSNWKDFEYWYLPEYEGDDNFWIKIYDTKSQGHYLSRCVMPAHDGVDWEIIKLDKGK